MASLCRRGKLNLHLVELEGVILRGTVGGNGLVTVQDIGDEGQLVTTGNAAGPFDEGGFGEVDEAFAGFKVPGFVVDMDS